MSSLLPATKTPEHWAQTAYTAGLHIGRISGRPKPFCGGSVTAARPGKEDETRIERLSPEHQPWSHATLGQLPGYFSVDKSGGSGNQTRFT